MNNFQLSPPDDDDDLELLRLAALQTLKRKQEADANNADAQFNQQNQPFENSYNFRGGRGGRNKRGRFFGSHPSGSWSGKNFQGQFNRPKNPNLISITPVNPESEPASSSNQQPADGGISKFDRYNKSDKSESESEEEVEATTEEESPAKLQRANSLEALMQELDNEIQGKPVDGEEEKQKLKKVKKKKRKVSACDSKASDTDKEQPPSGSTEVHADNENKLPISTEDVSSSVPAETEGQESSPKGFQYRKQPRSRSPNRRFMHRRRGMRSFPPNVPNPPPLPPFGHPPQFMGPDPQVMPFPPHPFNPFGPPIIQNPMPHPFFDRPLSPLGINTESIAATARAPLSPRSAAFVLQNKAIVEKRKRSPRRSYSRSPSRSLSRSPRRSPRRSLTPIRRMSRSPRRMLSPRRRSLSPRRRSMSPRRRSLTPKKRSMSPRKRSISPRKRSLSPRRRPLSPRKRSLSPRKRSVSPRKRSLSPRKRSMSPRRRSPLSPRRRPLSPLSRRRSISPRRKRPVKTRDAKDQEDDKKNVRPPIHERLGNKSQQKTEDKEKNDEVKEGDESVQKKEEDKPVDPVLEARRRKFESNEIKKKEGIIRLRPKEDKSKEDKLVEDEKAKDVNPKEENTKVVKQNEDKPKESEETKMKETSSSSTVPTPVSSSATSSALEPSSSITSTSETSVTSTTPPIPSSTTPEGKPKAETKKIDDIPDEFEELERLLNAPLPELDDIVNPKVDDIFSDEDSASDNEGRFKAKKTGEKAPPVLSFSKLVNGVKQEIKTEALPDSRPNRRARNYDRDRRRRERTTPPKREEKPEPSRSERTAKPEMKKAETSEKVSTKQRSTFKTARRSSPVMDKKFERKIEIKIKNPSKYEKQTKVKEEMEEKPKPQEEDYSKVEVKKEVESEEDEPEIIIENDSDDDDEVVAESATKGDLRAQLSKKRAEKLQRVPVEEVSSRLLQYALEGAVFKKSKKKKKKEKDISSSELAAISKLVHADYFTRKFCLSFKTERKVMVYKHKSFRVNYGFLRRPDGKLPIHLRLGMLNDPEVYLEVKPKRKSRKRKHKEVIEQV
ncbi:unnamed protein product [Acanthoscelides obtectus]|uniref:Uncharacterized protein n=1 Tax=Acanthoscelides obtectus TaxID=200917 RepID=A0A9P0LJD8_ACAOB|nr:unnamed protein product [Acanthoscelides obtectus]CAK1630199.1 hypothetical protein AOBTE_LOCUS6202 [Acanthoscelides obtectus]